MTFRCRFTLAVAATAALTLFASGRTGAEPWNAGTLEPWNHDTAEPWSPTAQVSSTDDPCRDRDWGDDRYRHCEVREQTMPSGPLTVDAGRNGGIRVESWDGGDIRVQAIVQAWATSDARARELGSAIHVETAGGRVSASGPDVARREGWAVSYRITVPRTNDLELTATNGGISISGVSGDIRFTTRNGGVRLTDVGGWVRGETRNGGVNVALGGDRWDGQGLEVETTNGGVTLAIPEPYHADLETRTHNGGFRTDYPLTIQGELSPRRGISTQIGAGGAPVKVRTRNGGLRINRR